MAQVLAHRLGLLPLLVNPDLFEYYTPVEVRVRRYEAHTA
jgi:hypothetical protein